eukprot:TRINITY_DN19287_c0_g1_i1.p1 TRINITY_DN19287_c0_g1~~TRINITY_DN19287_c0_g1_i1.p1  ORF type:complete len:389 (+),score=78.73 TRINITY_DN19287_c0_g1_i1:92-1258(+)
MNRNIVAILTILTVIGGAPSPIKFDNAHMSYHQDFDSLASTGRDVPFPSATGILEGWWVTKETYSAFIPGTVEGGIYSYGATDKSLGGLPSNAFHRPTFGFSMAVGDDVQSQSMIGFNISFAGQRWSARSANDQTLQCEYSVVSPATYESLWLKDDMTFGRWMEKPLLSFVATNQTAVSSGKISVNHVLAIDNWKGNIISIRWSRDKSDGDMDHLSMDDLQVSLIVISKTTEDLSLISPKTTSTSTEEKSNVMIILAVLGCVGAIAIVATIIGAMRYRRNRQYQQLATSDSFSDPPIEEMQTIQSTSPPIMESSSFPSPPQMPSIPLFGSLPIVMPHYVHAQPDVATCDMSTVDTPEIGSIQDPSSQSECSNATCVSCHGTGQVELRT